MCDSPCKAQPVYFKVIKDTPMWPVNTVLSTEGDAENKRLKPVHEFFNKTKCNSQHVSVEFATESTEFFERVYKSPTKKMLFVAREVFVNMLTQAPQADENNTPGNGAV